MLIWGQIGRVGGRLLSICLVIWHLAGENIRWCFLLDSLLFGPLCVLVSRIDVRFKFAQVEGRHQGSWPLMRILWNWSLCVSLVCRILVHWLLIQNRQIWVLLVVNYGLMSFSNSCFFLVNLKFFFERLHFCILRLNNRFLLSQLLLLLPDSLPQISHFNWSLPVEIKLCFHGKQFFFQFGSTHFDPLPVEIHDKSQTLPVKFVLLTKDQLLEDRTQLFVQWILTFLVCDFAALYKTFMIQQLINLFKSSFCFLFLCVK